MSEEQINPYALKVAAAFNSGDPWQVQRAVNDVLAALDAVTAERDRLRAALEPLVVKPPLSYGWHDVEPDCAFCGEWVEMVPHDPTCPWAIARAALAPPAAGE